MAVGHLKQLAPLADGLSLAAAAAARSAKKALRHRATRSGAVLKPGPATPLWNELARAALKALRRRGEKAKLARVLGVSRQRLHVLLVARTACPDAERALQLMAWLNARRRGIDPA